ncbi:MAG: hypothetical protein ACD_43C00264G0008 [uncultured bacterium]|nr:MAG: hypothetical protein ACD_43C00264G0008 [uncultured bacterium]
MPLIPDITIPTKPKSVRKPTKKNTTPAKTSAVAAELPSAKKAQSKQPATKPVSNSSVIQRKKRRWLKPLVIGLSIIIVFGAYSTLQAKRLYTAAQGTKAELEFAASSFEKQQFVQTKEHLQSAQNYLQTAQSASSGLFIIKWLPYVHKHFVVVDNLIKVGIHVTGAGIDILPIAEALPTTLNDDSATVSAITSKQRRTLLEAISNSPASLDAAQTELTDAVTALDTMPKSGLIGPVQTVVTLVNDNLPQLHAAVQKGIPFLKIAPIILGTPDAQTYLFLLQNNTELRPTGGFIGTYGILQLQDGDIKEFTTNNIYNLDNPVKKTLNITPPEPLQRFMGTTQWFMRDSNWHPDFAISGEKAIEFYHQENGPVENIDGVISVTPNVIHDLLTITGPITIDGDEYNAENLTEKLQYEVEVAFRKEGVSDSDRKAVIGKLANQIMERIMDTPKANWPDLVKVFLDNLEEKHILIYSKNSNVQALMSQISWDGSMHSGNGDFAMVVDTNLAALKTDRVMTKQIDYTITPENNDLIVDMTLRYKNDGQFDFFTTRYRTYTRIYVPADSELISSDGFLTNDRYLGGEAATAEVSYDADVDKAVFAGFISVEPQTEETIHLRYRLPRNLANQISESGYSLYFQKQSGTDNVTLHGDITMPEKIKELAPLDAAEKIDNTKVQFSQPLTTDYQLELHF